MPIHADWPSRISNSIFHAVHGGEHNFRADFRLTPFTTSKDPKRVEFRYELDEAITPLV